MTKDRWEKIQRLFDQAADLPQSERTKLLHQECGDDSSLRQQVESLLACDGIDALEQAVGRAAADATATAQYAVPEIAGKFRTTRILGEGGMGIVYEAEQSNPRRKVALKVMRGGRHASDRHRRLLLREAEALGRLQHPGIATIYESGVTEDGQPYLAMELVNGETLQQYLQRTPGPERIEKSDALERINLFLAVCAAIHYAHLNGVIHRDIKPGNIILPVVESTGSGSGPQMPVKVLDFGLARITQSDESMTHSGVIQGSIPFMSPEQVRGDSSKIDIRTDIYSLGILLYEMLTGFHPYFKENVGLVEGATIICNAPARDFRVWGRPFDEDLETIVLKAIEKDPALRYQSVLAFSDDIQRYLHNMPIQARPPSTIYQLRKLVSRHRLAFASLATLVVLLAAFGITSFVQAQRISAERDRANLEAANAKQVAEFLAGLFRNASPGRGGGADLSARDLLSQGRQRLDKELQNQPELRARLLDSIGSFYNTLLPYEEAMRAFKDARAIRHKLYGPDGNVAEAESWDGLSATNYNLGKYREAAEASMHAAAIRKKFPDAGDASNPVGDLTAAADSYSQTGDHELAAKLLGEARAWNTQHKSPPKQNISVLDTLAQIYRRQGEYRKAIPILQESLELKKKYSGEMSTMKSLNELGLANNLGGDPAEAAKYYREVLVLAPKYFGESHPNVAILSLNYAVSLNLLGKYAEAESTVRKATKMFETAGQGGHPSMSDFKWALAEALNGQDKVDEANREFQAALALNIKHYGEAELRTANSYFHLANSELRMGRRDSAMQNARKSLELLEKTKRTGIVSYGVAQMTMGKVLGAFGRKNEARPYLERAHKQLLDLLGPARIETKRAAAAISEISKSPGQG